jgi:predicted small secreted protein
MKRILKASLLFIVLLAGCMSVMACNTVEGAGQDIEEGGEAIQDAAD